jgi:hypothetical protein
MASFFESLDEYPWRVSAAAWCMGVLFVIGCGGSVSSSNNGQGGGANTEHGGTSGTRTTALGGLSQGGAMPTIGSTAPAAAGSAIATGGDGAGGASGRAGTTVSAGTTASAGSSSVSTVVARCPLADITVTVPTGCEPGIVASARIANVGFVLDRSNTMATTPTGYTATKWGSLRTAVSRAMTDFGNSDLGFGLWLYPYAGAVETLPTTCEYPADSSAIVVPPDWATATRLKIITSLDATLPGGGTPTAKALASVYDYFATGAGASIIGRTSLILVTDGGANCNAALQCGAETCTPNLELVATCGTGVANCCDPSLPVSGGLSAAALCLDHEAVVEQLQRLKTIGIQTFVIGLPGSEVYSTYLDQAAEAGGTARTNTPFKYYRAEATAATAGITSSIELIMASLMRSCTLPLSARIAELSRTELAINCKLVARFDELGQPQWLYDDTLSPPTLTLTGTLCDSIQLSGAQHVDMLDPCVAGP